MAYATSTDLTARYDERTIADLASDTGDPVLDLSDSTAVTAALAGASGRVNAAIQVGKQYDTSAVAALTGDGLAYLKDIVCALAMGRLLARRPEKFKELYEPMVEWAEKVLEQIRKGQNVLGIAENHEAGLPTIDGPSAVDYQRLNMIPDRTRNFYPARQTRLPIGR